MRVSNDDAATLAHELKRLILPMLFAFAATGASGVVDALYVSALGGDALAALSFVIPLVMFVSQLFVGFAIGMTSAIARARGAGDAERAERVARHGLWLGGATALAISAALWVGGPALLSILRADPALEDLIGCYLRGWIPGILGLFLTAWGTATLRGLGETRTSRAVFLLQAAVNLGLDPLFIFGLGPLPALGLAGASLANCLSYAASSALTFWYLSRRGFRCGGVSQLRGLVASSRMILAVALPAILTYSVVPITTGVFVRLLAPFGAAAVAAYGVAVRVEAFAVMIPLAVGAGLGPFVGHRWGAADFERIAQAAHWCRIRTGIWGLTALLVLVGSSSTIGELVSDDPHTASITTVVLRIVPAGFASYGAIVVTSAVYNNLGRATRGSMLAVMRMLLAIALGFIAARALGLYAVYAALPIASIAVERAAACWLARDLSALTRPPPACHESAAGSRSRCVRASDWG